METLDDVRDWLARDNGWTIYTDGLPTPLYLAPGLPADAECTTVHPHPPTIDGAAAALSEGWRWQKSDLYWFAFWPLSANIGSGVSTKNTGDEIADRYRLAKAARIAMKGKR